MTDKQKEKLIALTDYMPVNRGAWNKYTGDLLDYVEGLLPEQELKEEYKRGLEDGVAKGSEQFMNMLEQKVEVKQPIKEIEPTTKCFKCGRIYKAKEIGCCFND